MATNTIYLFVNDRRPLPSLGEMNDVMRALSSSWPDQIEAGVH
jgi:hypothetical protein